MNSQRNGFLVFLCSLIPGAGEMYLGFMKQGISIMAIFWGILFIAAGLNLEVVVFLLPIVWCYSFFHVHNLKKLPYDQFEAEEDKFLIPDTIQLPNIIGKKSNTIIAGLLIFVGVAILWNTVFIDLIYAFSSYTHFPRWVVEDILYRMPQLVLAIALIIVGVVLIRGKYKEVYSETEDMPKEDTKNNQEFFDNQDFSRPENRYGTDEIIKEQEKKEQDESKKEEIN